MRVEYPPVAIAVMAWHTESYRFIPPSRRNTIRADVSMMYALYMSLAVSENLEDTLVTVGPGVSAPAIVLALIPKLGSKATNSTMIPMPPSHCVRQRQKSIDLGRASTSSRMVDPVVENPEQVSKSASGKDVMLPERRKGTEPIRDAIIQAEDTMK